VRDLVVITGMSGAGRSTASRALEDSGFFVIDNLPARFIVEAVEGADSHRDRLAVVVDTRGGLSFDALEQALDVLEGRGVPVRVLFLDAGDEVLVSRFQESRRPHPVEAPTLVESLAAERQALERLRSRADLVLDTGGRSVHELRAAVQEAFGGGPARTPLRVSVLSFGFKHGLPQSADTVLDVRFLPNPHWVPALRDLTGLDPAVREHVLGWPEAEGFLTRVRDLLDYLLPRYEVEGKAYFTLAVGCTGGHHRSVAIGEELARWLREAGVAVTISHRDVDR
jgi:UPF0042 nucleotide-binding protein